MAGPAPATPRAAGGVTGAWDLTTQVLSTTNENDKGLRLGYRVDLVQNGDRITGRGYKTTQNGQAISDGQITLQGTIDGRELVLTFAEQGARRSNNGRFVLSMGNDDTLRGSFASDAARSRGTIYARRRR